LVVFKQQEAKLISFKNFKYYINFLYCTWKHKSKRKMPSTNWNWI